MTESLFSSGLPRKYYSAGDPNGVEMRYMKGCLRRLGCAVIAAGLTAGLVGAGAYGCQYIRGRDADSAMSRRELNLRSEPSTRPPIALQRCH